MKRILMTVAAAVLAVSAQAADQKAANLDQLLDMVRKAQTEGSELNRKREAEFRAAKDQQARLLQQAQAEITALENEGAALQKQFQANEDELARLEEARTARVGNLGELFGVVRQVAGDTAARLNRSYVSAQFPGRAKLLEEMAQSRGLPKMDELRALWMSLQQEMTELGKVSRFNAQVVLGNGSTEQRSVTRIGGFNLIGNGEYLVFSPETKQIQELARQPAGRILDPAAAFEKASSGVAPVFVDPSRGAMLAAVVQSPSMVERYHQGGTVGYVITGVFILGVLIVLERLITLSIIGGKVNAQIKSATPGNNPLGRIMSVYLANKDSDTDNLELKLDEAIMKEVPRLERGIAMVKVFAALAPLLGLLGTVTGMIETFQVITTFGAGDPKMMAGGISSALVTTVQGIITAIPLVFLHSVVSSRSRSVIHVLEEQSVGLIAQHSEKQGA